MTLRRSFSAASTFSSLVILLETRRLPPFSVDRAGTRPSSMDLTRPPSNSFRVLTQRSLLVPVLQIPLSPLWILSPREVRHTEDLWIEASTTGHVTWQSATLDLGWTLRAMAVVHDHKRRMAFKLAPSRTYISSDAWTPFVIPLLSLSPFRQESSPLSPSGSSPTSLFLATLNDSVFIWLTPSAILFSTRRQQQGGNAAARR